MERMNLLLKAGAALLLLSALVSCEDMVLRDEVADKVAAFQDPPAKDGRLSLLQSGVARAFGATMSTPLTKAGAPVVYNLSIKNSGLTNLNITSTTVGTVANTASGNGSFVVDTQPASPLAPSGTTNFTVTYNPGTATTVTTAVLTLVSTDVDHPTFTVNLSSACDANPPTGSVSITGGLTRTNSLSVPLTVTGSDTGGSSVALMEFSNDNSTFTTSQAYATSKTHTIPGGDGTKTIYVRLTDGAGNQSTSTISTTIDLDQTRPTVSSVSPVDAATNHTKTTSPTVTFAEAMKPSSMTTGPSGTVQLKIGSNVQAGTISNTGGNTWTIAPTGGLKYGITYSLVVTTGVQDAAGNSMLSSSTTSFLVEDDQYENSQPFDLSPVLNDSSRSGTYNFNSTAMQAVAYGGLGILKNFDQFKIQVLPGFSIDRLRIRVFFTDSGGSVVTAAGADSLTFSPISLGFAPTGFSNAGLGSIPVQSLNSANERELTVDLTGTNLSGKALDDGIYTFTIDGNASAFTNRRIYNVEWELHYGGI